jgi:hypothetical protein
VTIDVLRHYCRNPRCRSKLSDPVENTREAFCCRGCYRQFYRSRCLMCEAAMERKTGNQRLCGRRKCKNGYRTSGPLGRYFEGSRGVGPQDVILDARNPIKQGISLPLETGIRYRLWGPKLTDQQIHLATLGWKPERRKPGKSIPTNIIGGHKFPGAPAIKLAAVRLEPEAPVAPELPIVPSVPLAPADDADPLEIPPFLARRPSRFDAQKPGDTARRLRRAPS